MSLWFLMSNGTFFMYTLFHHMARLPQIGKTERSCCHFAATRGFHFIRQHLKINIAKFTIFCMHTLFHQMAWSPHGRVFVRQQYKISSWIYFWSLINQIFWDTDFCNVNLMLKPLIDHSDPTTRGARVGRHRQSIL